MINHDDQPLQVDATEGPVKRRDRRGLDFLLNTLLMDDLDVCTSAEEILETPEVQRLQEQVEAEKARLHQVRLNNAHQRLRQGKKAFLHKMVYIPSGDFLREDITGGGFSIPDLTEMGLDGWEVVGFLLRRQRYIAGGLDEHIIGAYFLLKKELVADEGSTLEGLEP